MVAAHARRRRVVRTAAFCAAVSLASAALIVAPAVADAPATSVSGLTQGARGEAVKQLQQALLNQGIAVSGGVDGVFGPGTTAALKQFQQSKGLPASGVVDDATALALGLGSSPLLGLTQGNRGAAVKELQQRLLNAGIAVPGGADGVFGSATTAALKQFQQAKGLTASGAVDAATAAALGAVSSNGPSTGSPPSSNTGSPSNGSLVGLKIGARGDAVKTLQQQLIAAGFSMVGGADGVFGVLTASALSAFQRSVDLKPTAVVDEATAAALANAAPGGGGGSGGGGSNGGATSPLLGLQYGATGNAVKMLQETLMRAGVTVRGGADGVFGLATQTALKQYQQAVGVPATGKVDEATAGALASGKTVNGGGSSSPLLGLKAGSLGASVKALQEALIKAGITVRGGADGIFGPATAEALKSFQTSQGLPATGVVDDATVAALANPRPVTGGGTTTSSTGYAQYGEKGARVIALQTALVRAGIAVRGGVDGDFGAGTSAAVMDFQRANGLPVTGRVDDATAAKLGLAKQNPPSAPDPSTVSLAAFPVQGRCYFTDTWMATRSGGRVHLGVDVIAPQGKLVYAVANGTITKVYRDYPGSLSGNGVRLTQSDGTYFFYAHMVSVAEGIGEGTKVKAGQVVGYVGSTGSSATNHLHFEVHPKGGAAVNPYPMIKAIDACSRTDPLPHP